MSKIKLLSFAILILIVINLGMLVFLVANKRQLPPETNESMRLEGPREIIIDRLHFDKQQVLAYDKLINQHRELMRELNGRIHEMKNSLYQLLKMEPATPNDSLINQLGELQKKIEQVHFSHFTQIKKLCRPEQLVEFKELIYDLANYFSTEKNRQPIK